MARIPPEEPQRLKAEVSVERLKLKEMQFQKCS